MPAGVASALHRVASGRITVKARSSIHDTTCVWSEVAGDLTWDGDHPEAAAAELKVDMRVFDAGDRLKNWKLKSDLEPDKHPTATFRLTRLEDIKSAGGKLAATAVGVLAWRGRETEVRATGTATIGDGRIDAEARFDLDVTRLGVQPPKILMFKVEPTVLVEVSLAARRA